MSSTQDKIGAEVFTPVVGSRVSSAIVLQVRELIRSGALQPGDRLPPERDLAESFGVSRVSVRDALRVLEAIGLVQIRVGASGGAAITVPGSDLVGETLENMFLMTAISPDDVAELRVIIELGVITIACVSATEEDIAGMLEYCDLEDAALAEGTYTRKHSEEFHARMSRITGNRAMSTLARSFEGPLSMYEARSRRPPQERYTLGVSEHRGIVEALAKRDVAAARHRVAAHLLEGLPEPRRAKLLDAFVPSEPVPESSSGGHRAE
jgi:GntR family transcriptional repressor for pyruvate dehydrogenase complex